MGTLEQQRLLEAMLYWKHSRPVFSAPPLYGTLTSDETYLVVPACGASTAPWTGWSGAVPAHPRLPASVAFRFCVETRMGHRTYDSESITGRLVDPHPGS